MPQGDPQRGTHHDRGNRFGVADRGENCVQRDVGRVLVVAAHEYLECADPRCKLHERLKKPTPKTMAVKDAVVIS